MLDSAFHWPIDESRPELGSCPVVIIGHAVENDTQALSHSLGIDPSFFDTVVRTVDTQDLSLETGYWPQHGNPVGLKVLVGRCGFEYRDAHTACNDAAMTLICAVTMVLPASSKPDDALRSLQNVADKIEASSAGHDWYFGVAKYCMRCGSKGHTQGNYNGRPCKKFVKCAHCASSKVEKRKKAAFSHITSKRIVYAIHGEEAEG